MNYEAEYNRDVYTLLTQHVKSIYERLTKLAIEEIKALPDNCRMGGDDSDLENVWEEYKYQIQTDQGPFFFAYKHTIEQIAYRLIHEFPRELQQMLWVWTDAFDDAWGHEDKVSFDNWNAYDLVRKLKQSIDDVACNEDLLVDPDEERNRERHELDSQWGEEE